MRELENFLVRDHTLGPGTTSGRTRAIVIHPTDTDKMWAGSIGGGVWYSADSGATWSPTTEVMSNLAVSCLAVDPSDPQKMYAGTGEGFYNVDADPGFGIYAGDGNHWSNLSPTAYSPDFQYVNRLAVSKDGAVVLAATGTGLFRSTDVYRTWTKVLTGQAGVPPFLPNTPIFDVKFHPTDASKAVAAGYSEVFHTTDGGLTWTASLSLCTQRIELAYAAHDPSIVYASGCTANIGSNGKVASWTSYIWRSIDGGATFTLRNSSSGYLGTQGWYGNAIWAGDPSTSDFVLVGGIDLWKSTDGGTALTRISDGSVAGSVHSDHHAIVSHPKFGTNSNKTVFFGNDGGIYKTSDISTAGTDAKKKDGWSALNHGYFVTQFYSAAGNATAGKIVGGAQDNGTLVYSGNAETWSMMRGGDGGFCASDPNDANYFYGENFNLSIFRSTDGGANSDFICGVNSNAILPQDFWKAVPYRIPDTAAGTAAFIAPFVLDPSNSNRILAGGVSLWRTNDAKTANTNTTGPSWAQIKLPLASNSNISAIAIAPSDPNTVWVGYETGEIHKSTNATSATPTWLSAGTCYRVCTRLVIAASDKNTVYACFGGFVSGNIQKTVDGGAHWTDASNGLPKAPVRALTIHPSRFGLIFAGTEVGMFISTNGGTTWSANRKSPSASPVDDLIWFGTDLVLVTHGRGMFSIIPSTPLPKPLNSPCLVVSATNHLHAFYRDENNHIADLYRTDQWHYRDLTTTGVPLAEGKPRSVVYANQTHVFFRDKAGHISDIYYTDRWNYQDLHSMVTGAALAQGDPFAVLFINSQLHVLYRDANNQISDIYYTDRWHYQNLHSCVSGPALAQGDPSAVLSGNQLHVFYRDSDNRIWDIYWADRWLFTNVFGLVNAVPAKGDPSAVAFANQMHVVYRDANNAISDLYWTDKWNSQVLISSGGAGVLNGEPFPIVFGDQLHVLYRSGTRGPHISDLYYSNSSWLGEDLNSKAGTGTGARAEDGPFSVVFANQLHVFYRDANDHVSDFFFTQSWNYQDVTVVSV